MGECLQAFMWEEELARCLRLGSGRRGATPGVCAHSYRGRCVDAATDLIAGCRILVVAQTGGDFESSPVVELRAAQPFLRPPQRPPLRAPGPVAR